MSILITGAAGQLGPNVLVELEKRNIEHVGVDILTDDIIDVLNITDVDATYAYMKGVNPC
jgi:nucleoside-diphosphate-sugar epimerase